MLIGRPKTLICAVFLCGVAFSQAQTRLSAAEASKHVGEQATVCGVVSSTHYAATTRGKPTFLNFDKPYPRQIFTALIWGSDRSKFGSPETLYENKHLCVTGRITSFRGVPEIVVKDPQQMHVQ